MNTYTATIRVNGQATFIHTYNTESAAHAFATRKLNSYDKQGIAASATIVRD